MGWNLAENGISYFGYLRKTSGGRDLHHVIKIDWEGAIFMDLSTEQIPSAHYSAASSNNAPLLSIAKPEGLPFIDLILDRARRLLAVV